MSVKQVRFYTPQGIDEQDKPYDFDPDFWPTLRGRVDSLSAAHRTVTHSGASFFGHAGTGYAPALPYLRVGRLRTRSDWPDVLGESGEITQLAVDGALLESGFMVPFGAVNRVAIMGPIQGLVSISAITAWLVAVLDLSATGHSLELVPEVDPKLMAKLDGAVGATKLAVKIPAGETIAWPAGKHSVVEQAIDEAIEASKNELDVTLTFSYGGRKAATMKDSLLAAARRLKQGSGASKIEANLMLPVGDTGGFRVEMHDLLNDQVAKVARFHADDAEQLSTDEILEGIDGAIKEFQAL